MNHTYGQLPTVVSHDNRVSDFQCRLYTEISSLSNKYGYCFASNEYLGKTFSKSPETISRAISGLQKLSYLTVIIEDGYKRKMKVKMDFSDMEPIDENVKGGSQKDQGGLTKMSRGVDENVMTANNIIQLDKSNKIIEEPENKNDLLVETVKEVNGFIESTYEIIKNDDEPFDLEGNKITVLPDKEQNPPPTSEAPPAPKKERKQKDQAYKIFPPTLEEVVPLMYDKLVEKKRVHTNIVDCWNNANMQAEKFILHHEGKGWKIQKLNSAIALWVNNAIGYGQVTKPCPIQYKGNPANAQPAQPTKVHVEQPVLTQQDIEASEQHFAGVRAMFKQMGV